MHGKQPAIVEIVAVGAIAMVFELRMPCFLTCSRTGVQSSLPPRLTVDSHTPFLFKKIDRILREKPRSHFEPLYDE